MPGPYWRFSYQVMPELPPLAWVARVTPPLIDVRCGASVRREESGFFEGTWAGRQELSSIAESTTVFGSGIVACDGSLLIVPPSHTHDGVYGVRVESGVTVSNSIVALLVAEQLVLDPAVPYPTIFCEAARLKVAREDVRSGRLVNSQIKIPTRSRPVLAFYFENVRVGTDGSPSQVAKPRERAFTTYADYRQRLIDATRSLLENGQPYEPVVALSAGYDSTAVAVVASQLGCRQAVTLASGRSFADGGTTEDSGRAVAHLLGLECAVLDRLAYQDRADLVEADFLASGMSGEDVVFSAFEERLKRTIFLTGFWTGDLWVKSKMYPQPYLPGDFAGCTMTEFRLKNDFIHVPLPCFAAFPAHDEHPFVKDDDMRPYSIGGDYDRVIPRRLAEEGGLPRGSFATTKRAATMLLHRSGKAAFAPATVASIEDFALAEGATATFAPRARPGRTSRGMIRAAYALRVPRLVAPLERRRQRAVTFEPRFGTLLFRWAVSVVRPRYRTLEPPPNSHGTTG